MRVRLFIFLCFVSAGLWAQSSSEAEGLFNARQYAKAKAVYEQLLAKRPKDALNNYRLARCCYELKDYEKAVKHFEMSGKKYPLREMYLGECYFNTYRFDESVSAYETYLAGKNVADDQRAEIEARLQKANIAAGLLKRVEDVAIIDSMQVSKNEFVRFYKMSKELGTLSQQRIKTRKQMQDQIEYTTERADRRIFSDSVKSGLMNIFSSMRLLDEWSKPVSVSSNVNTKSGNENYPFLLLDGITLYYASDGPASIGGYDILMTRYSAASKDYLEPENVGFPFNSPANDYMMVIDDLHNRGWFATDRNQPAGKVMIYEFLSTDDKVFVHTDDSVLLRNKAALKTYRKAQVKKENTLTSQPVELKEDTVAFRVVINDSTVYTHQSEFKSKVALDKFREWKTSTQKLQQSKEQLDSLRNSYALSENVEEQQKLAPEILSLEKNVQQLTETSRQLLMECGNEEDRALRGKFKN